MTHHDTLFSPARMGDLDLPNRVLMAPLTRNRAHGDGTPKEMAVPYYRQRASAGLIFTEATQISAMGKGYLDTPGLYTDAHAEAWRKITDAVHANGGRIFVQLWHVGRISHTSLLPDGRAPLSASAVQAKAQTFTANGFEDCSKPEAMSEEQIADTLAEYRHSAKLAKEAGFDGIEVHAANGYLLDQFLQDGVNQRDDRYGGSIENRMCFLQEVLDTVGEIWSPDRTGVRLSPLGQANDIRDSDRESLFAAVIDMLDRRKLAYLHMVEAFPGSSPDDEDKALVDRLRQLWSGFFIGNGGYDAEAAASAIEAGRADAITFGRPFIANPDLPERIRAGAALNEADADTFYGGDETGYTDYPFMDHPGDKVA